MFPARAGMSLGSGTHLRAPRHVPRASGDEPHTGVDADFEELCSPRERG